MHVYFEHLNESFVTVRAERSVLLEMNEYFSFVVPDHKFMPAFKCGAWDGKIRLLNLANGQLPKGLISQAAKWCKHNDYTFEIDSAATKMYKADLVQSFSWDDYNLPDYINVYDYQDTAVTACLEGKRAIAVSATASGKSLIIWAIARRLVEQGAKVLITVPSVSLVTQLYENFEEYDQAPVEDVHLIYGGAEKQTDKQTVIGTWQSLYQSGSQYLGQFDAVLSDEVHEMEAKSGQKLMNSCVNAFFRVGFTGSLKDAKMNQMTLTGLYGPVKQISSNKQLQDRNILANLQIYVCLLKHQDAKRLGQATYQEEKEHVVNSAPRNKLILRLADRTSGTTLVLFDGVENHGWPLYQAACEQFVHKTPYFVYRNTPAQERDDIRKIANEREDVVIFATYKIYQRGINIVNLSNIILAGPTKSKIRLLQSIGRGLRRSESKTLCNLFDLADDLSADRQTNNRLLEHCIIRYEVYQQEQFNVQQVPIDLDDYNSINTGDVIEHTQ